MMPRLIVLPLIALASALSWQLCAGEAEEQGPEALVAPLASSDSETVNKAVSEIQRRIDSDPHQAVFNFRQFWLKPLQDAGRYDLIETLALRLILAVSAQTEEVEFLQELRVRSLLAAGKSKEALSQAKALFNVASLKRTDKVLLLLAKCFQAASPGDPQVFRQFVGEQKAAATMQPPTDTPSKSGLLATVVVDATAYKAAIDKIKSDNDRDLLAKGNLLLLMDRPKEAKAVFERIHHSDDASSLSFHESVARAIRADDGNVGRANGYLLAIPDEQLQPRLDVF